MTFMEELGRGAYGKVYKGVLTELAGVEVFFKPKEERVEITEGRIVAVKTLLGTNFNHVTSRTSRRFRLRSVQNLRHLVSPENTIS